MKEPRKSDSRNRVLTCHAPLHRPRSSQICQKGCPPDTCLSGGRKAGCGVVCRRTMAWKPACALGRLGGGAGREKAVTVDSGTGDGVVSRVTMMKKTGTVLMRTLAFTDPSLHARHCVNPSPQKPYEMVISISLPSTVHTGKLRIGDYLSHLSSHMELAGLGF